jgi:DNA replication initiation complex subunit (GINS family)
MTDAIRTAYNHLARERDSLARRLNEVEGALKALVSVAGSAAPKVKAKKVSKPKVKAKAAKPAKKAKPVKKAKAKAKKPAKAAKSTGPSKGEIALRVVREAGGPMSAKDVLKKTNGTFKDLNNAGVALAILAKRGKLTRVGKGQYTVAA